MTTGLNTRSNWTASASTFHRCGADSWRTGSGSPSRLASSSPVAARDSVSRQLEQSQRRFEVGLIAITDVQQSQAGFDDAVAVEIQAQRLLATSHEQLREIIGEIETDLASPTDDLPLLSPDPANAE